MLKNKIKIIYVGDYMIRLLFKNDKCNRVGDNLKYKLIVIKGRINYKLFLFIFF